jgi:hypothetical protein
MHVALVDAYLVNEEEVVICPSSLQIVRHHSQEVIKIFADAEETSIYFYILTWLWWTPQVG